MMRFFNYHRLIKEGQLYKKAIFLDSSHERENKKDFGEKRGDSPKEKTTIEIGSPLSFRGILSNI